jgi:hypothetical protein
MLSSHDTPREGDDMVDSREPRHISECAAEALKEMAEANPETFVVRACPSWCTDHQDEVGRHGRFVSHLAIFDLGAVGQVRLDHVLLSDDEPITDGGPRVSVYDATTCQYLDEFTIEQARVFGPFLMAAAALAANEAAA